MSRFVCVVAILAISALIDAQQQQWPNIGSGQNVDIQSFNYNPGDFPALGNDPRRTSTSTTTPAPSESTTAKGGFFSGLKKFFGGGKTESTTSTTTTTTTTARPTVAQSRPTQAPAVAPVSPTTARNAWTSTSTAPSVVQNRPPEVPQHRVTSTTARPVIPVEPRAPTPSVAPRGPSSSTTASPSAGSPASDDELATLAGELFNKDTNNLARYVTAEFQGRTQSSTTDDTAPKKLLTVDEANAFAVPTVEKLRPLFNNYEIESTTNEYVTPFERREESDFLDAVLATSVMRHAMNFLQQKGQVSPDPKTHKDLLRTIWFSLYSRGQGRIGSSAFEHVFLAETKGDTINGLHNWVYFYEEEQAGRVDYKGWMKKLELGNKGSIVKLRFCRKEQGLLAQGKELCKPTNSLFVGTSPELELALYTVCFQLRADQPCPLAYNGKTFNIKTHTFRYRGKNLIGSAFVEI